MELVKLSEDRYEYQILTEMEAYAKLINTGQLYIFTGTECI